MVIQSISGDQQPLSVVENLTHSPFYVRVYDPPFDERKEKIIQAIVDAIRVYEKTDDYVLEGWTSSLQFKVMVDLREPLIDEVQIA